MKTKNKLTVLALIVAAWPMNITTLVGQPIDSVESLKNRAVAASPRAKEIFPWLTRSTAPAVTPVMPSDSNAVVAEAMKNRAFAASPRMLEQFPELARAAQPVKSADTWVPSTVIKNRAFASSPRVREQFPWLERGRFAVGEQPFEIAPLK